MTNELSNTTQFIVTEHNNGHISFCETNEDAEYWAKEFQKDAPSNSDTVNFTIFTRQEWLEILAENEGDE